MLLHRADKVTLLHRADSVTLMNKADPVTLLHRADQVTLTSVKTGDCRLNASIHFVKEAAVSV